jgi:endonuclease YncB( thermonuclease family)
MTTMSIRERLYHYEADVLKVTDGDTYVIHLHGGFYWWDNPNVVLRLNGCDCYETSLREGTTPEQKEIGLQAKAYVKELMEGKRIIIHSIRPTPDSFGRILADVYVGDEEMNLAEDLLSKGYAVPWEKK